MKTGFTLLIALCLTASIQAQVLSNDAVVGGKTVGEWSAEWWKWALATPTNKNALLDPDGSRANNGQPRDAVFFVSGTLQGSSLQPRSFSVPVNRHIFLPLVNT